MEVLGAKIIALVLMLFLTLIAGLLPIKLVAYLSSFRNQGRRSKAEYFISLLNCLAGGVFLGTTLLHLLPEVTEGMEELLQKAGIDTEFAVGEFVVSVGFFVIMLLEHLVMALQHHRSHGSQASQGLQGSQEGVGLLADSLESNRYGAVTDSAVTEHSHGHSHSGHSHGYTAGPSTSYVPGSPNKAPATSTQNRYPALKASTDNGTTSLPGSPSKGSKALDTDATTTHTTTEPPHDCQTALMVDIETREDNCVHIIETTHHQQHHTHIQNHGLRSLLLLLALSLHTVFEGLALGLQTTSRQVWTLFFAVSIHKVIIAFTMGVQFATTFPQKWRVVVFMLVFALMSPIGVAIGITVTSAVQDSWVLDVSNVVLQGFATGTFVYVTFFEVLQKEVGQDHSILKVFVVMLGYGVIALVNLFLPA